MMTHLFRGFPHTDQSKLPRLRILHQLLNRGHSVQRRIPLCSDDHVVGWGHTRGTVGGNGLIWKELKDLRSVEQAPCLFQSPRVQQSEPRSCSWTR